MHKIAFAHSHPTAPQEEWHYLAEHLEATADRAEAKVCTIGLTGWGRALGLLHDLGKYSAEFQARVRGSPDLVDHSTAGGQLAAQLYGPIGRLLAYAIVGHHGGLPNGISDPRRIDSPTRTPLLTRLANVVPSCEAWRNEVVPPPSVTTPRLNYHPTVGQDRVGFSLAHATRMSYSALVDSDHIDTEAYYARMDGWLPNRGDYPSPGILARQLDQHMGSFKSDTGVRRIRSEILAAAREAAPQPPGLFSMTVPTGGGKTLSSMVWALRHARARGLSRVIMVIPYTSIIEQTAEVLRGALGPLAHCVVEHHSSYRERGEAEGRAKLRRATENWDAPIIVTTNVQFYESLYAARPGTCRKLHNIARSVVILDEAQSLPPTLLMPCIVVLDEMARNYGTSILLCTATQPAILERPEQPSRSLVGGLRDVREIAPSGLHDRLRRVTVRSIGRLSDSELAMEITLHRQTLTIVNTRRHARDLYVSIRGVDGAAHLSALMCPAHRSLKLHELRQRLLLGEPMRLVSTSLIEAGVDIDVPLVWRAMAGLSSIAQAAGRCNREGLRRAADSVVTVFEADTPEPSYMRIETAVARVVLAEHNADPLSPAAIDAYFSQLFWRRSLIPDGLDTKRILPRLEERRVDLLFPFEDIETDFRLIEEELLPVIIPYDDEARRLIAELGRTENPSPVARALQRYTVQIPPNDLANFVAAGDVTYIASDRWQDQFPILTGMSRYGDDIGLDLWR